MVIGTLGLVQCGTSKMTETPQTANLEDRVAHTLIIAYEKAPVKKQVEKKLKKYDAFLLKNFDSLNMMSVYFPDEKDIPQAMEVLQQLEGIKSVERDQIVSINEEQGVGVDMEIRVASETRVGYGVGPMTCLLVKFTPEAESWQYMYDAIQGFDYEPGYEYVLQVHRSERKNPPQDASKYVYRLKKVIDKQKKNSEGMPEK